MMMMKTKMRVTMKRRKTVTSSCILINQNFTHLIFNICLSLVSISIQVQVLVCME